MNMSCHICQSSTGMVKVWDTIHNQWRHEPCWRCGGSGIIKALMEQKAKEAQMQTLAKEVRYDAEVVDTSHPSDGVQEQPKNSEPQD